MLILKRGMKLLLTVAIQIMLAMGKSIIEWDMHLKLLHHSNNNSNSSTKKMSMWDRSLKVNMELIMGKECKLMGTRE